jgi:hypothetical protein
VIDSNAPAMNLRDCLIPYDCHKRVYAGKITEVQDGALMLLTGSRIQLKPEYFEKHKPEVGGYFVLYADGYQSYSPAGPFESGYTMAHSSKAST